ncbi:MAG: BatD family protein, partial [Verrucomicrobiae bacterium]|nr:BatD family protein [Verrucomicrobiae bacterium]
MNLIPCDKRLRTARRSSPWAWLTILTLAFRLASAATVTATLDRAEISLGESAHLGIAVQGAAMVRAPQIPAVEGLTFRYAGQQMSFQMINGAMSGSATHSYEVVPQRAGEFQIPAIAVPVGTEISRTSPLQLRVGAAASAPPPPPHA